MPAANTITKALRLIREMADIPPLAIELVKNIPSESGLGGGSSDAAGFLRFARHQYVGFLSDIELRDIAQAVGADVPFFLIGSRAIGEGYGEHLRPIPAEGPEDFVIVMPDAFVSTAEAYGRLDEAPYPWRELPEEDVLYNDFERVAPEACRDLKDKLRAEGALDAGLTGSGSAVFGRFASSNDAERAAGALENSVPWVRKAKACAVHDSW